MMQQIRFFSVFKNAQQFVGVFFGRLAGMAMRASGAIGRRRLLRMVSCWPEATFCAQRMKSAQVYSTSTLTGRRGSQLGQPFQGLFWPAYRAPCASYAWWKWRPLARLRVSSMRSTVSGTFLSKLWAGLQISLFPEDWELARLVVVVLLPFCCPLLQRLDASPIKGGLRQVHSFKGRRDFLRTLAL